MVRLDLVEGVQVRQVQAVLQTKELQVEMVMLHQLQDHP
jgi:hypothetical protein